MLSRVGNTRSGNSSSRPAATKPNSTLASTAVTGTSRASLRPNTAGASPRWPSDWIMREAP